MSEYKSNFKLVQQITFFFLNSIAIVILPRRLTYNTYVQPINRPTVLTDTFEGIIRQSKLVSIFMIC
jgi:hypothetical protein